MSMLVQNLAKFREKLEKVIRVDVQFQIHALELFPYAILTNFGIS